MRDHTGVNMFYKAVSIVQDYENDVESASRIAASIVATYDWSRVNYASENDWDLYDLDRWELASRAYKERPTLFIMELDKFGICMDRDSLDRVMSDGDLFIKLLVDPLWEQDVEIMDFSSIDLLNKSVWE